MIQLPFPTVERGEIRERLDRQSARDMGALSSEILMNRNGNFVDQHLP
jgi:hypothetical protein